MDSVPPGRVRILEEAMSDGGGACLCWPPEKVEPKHAVAWRSNTDARYMLHSRTLKFTGAPCPVSIRKRAPQPACVMLAVQFGYYLSDNDDPNAIARNRDPFYKFIYSIVVTALTSTKGSGPYLAGSLFWAWLPESWSGSRGTGDSVKTSDTTFQK
jgi:hypothetical protein